MAGNGATVEDRERSVNAVDPPRAAAASTASVLPYGFAVVGLMVTYWCVDIVSPALPDAQRALGLSATAAGLVFAVFFGGRLIANVPAAWLVERSGARWTAATGALFVVVGSLLAAVANGSGSLLFGRAIQGVGVALLVTALLLSVLRARPEHGAAMTIFNLAATVGGAAGLLSGGVLTRLAGWRAVFVLTSVLAVGLLVASLVVRAQRRAAVAAHDGTAPAEAATDVGAGRRALAGALLANLLVYANFSVFVVSLPLYAAERFDASAERIASLLLAITVAHFVAAVPAGHAVRRWGAKRALAAGLLGAAAGMALVLPSPNELLLVVPLALYSIGQVFGTTAAGDLVLRLGGRGGRAVGLVRFSSDVGLVVGPAAVGALADIAGSEAPFVALAALTIVAAAATLPRSTPTTRPGGS